MTLTIPRFTKDITAKWLTDALAPKYPGIEVTSATLLTTIVGAASKAKIGLTYNDIGHQADLPPVMVAKSGFVAGRGDSDFLSEWDHIMMLLNEIEARFYRDYAPSMNVNLASCFFSATDSAGQSMIILEDLTASDCQFGSFDMPLDAEAMSKVLTLLAQVHARWWANPAIANGSLKDPMVHSGMLDAFLQKKNWDECMSRPRGKRVPSSLRDYDVVTRAIRKTYQLKLEVPLTLMHGDPHIGNMFFRKDGSPGLLDWQLMCAGSWSHDVAYSLSGAMTIENRRKHERDLLKHYLGQLKSSGAAAPNFDDAWLEYRRQMLFGFQNFLTPGDGIQSEDYISTVGERNATAAEDLETLDALGIS